MTEQEWLESDDPRQMVPVVSDAGRKLRLFACACCRQGLKPFVPPFVIRAVAAAEAFADGGISADALARVREVVGEAARAADHNNAANSGAWYFREILGACLSACCQSVNVAEV